MVKRICLDRTHKVLIALLLVGIVLIAIFEIASIDAIEVSNQHAPLQVEYKESERLDSSIPNKYKFKHLRNEEKKMFEALNAYRAENGLAALVWDDEMYISASWKSEAMGQLDYFGHHNPQFDDLSFKDDLLNKIFGYTYETAGENLAVDYIENNDTKTFDESFKLLKESQSHNAAMLSDVFTNVGISIICMDKLDEDGQSIEVIYVVQHFRK